MSAWDRREFLGGLLAGAVGLPSAMGATPLGRTERPDVAVPAVPAVPTDARVRDERYWEIVRAQFPIVPGLVLMNAANLCPSPFVVQEAVFELTRDVDRDASSQNRQKLGELRESARAKVAAHLGADADEIALVRNTSEANNTVVAGMDLSSGDEVVLWDQNHPTNQLSWEVRARRHGFTVKKVSTPAAPTSAEALMAPFLDALTPRTRVLSFSHVSNSSGVALPARELCAAARSRGIFVLLDGAQSCGALKMDLHAMGCDAYTASAHKWPTGPKEVGILYVRRERAAELWAADVGVGWEGAEQRGAQKFESLGQRDDGAVAAIGTAIDFHAAIGAEAIEARVKELAAAVRARVSERIPGTVFHTPADPALSAGVVVCAPPGLEPRPTLQRLYQEHRIALASTGGIRISAHLYNTLEEVDRVAEALAAVRA